MDDFSKAQRRALEECLRASRRSAEEHNSDSEDDQTEEQIEAEMERLTLIWRITDCLLAGESPETFVKQISYLVGLRPEYAIATMEALPREQLQLLTVDSWNWWLRVVPEGLKPAIESLWARWEFGPRHTDAIPTDDCDLLNARDYVARQIFERMECERKAEARARLERRRGLPKAQDRTDTDYRG